MFRELISVVLVLALLVSVLWFLRKKGLVQMNRIVAGAPRGSLVRGVNRIRLTPQHTLQILELDDRWLLLATSPSSCRLVREIRREEKATPQRLRAGGHS
jgi:flagellar biogenesis protein FliO